MPRLPKLKGHERQAAIQAALVLLQRSPLLVLMAEGAADDPQKAEALIAVAEGHAQVRGLGSREAPLDEGPQVFTHAALAAATLRAYHVVRKGGLTRE